MAEGYSLFSSTTQSPSCLANRREGAAARGGAQEAEEVLREEHVKIEAGVSEGVDFHGDFQIEYVDEWCDGREDEFESDLSEECDFHPVSQVGGKEGGEVRGRQGMGKGRGREGEGGEDEERKCGSASKKMRRWVVGSEVERVADEDEDEEEEEKEEEEEYEDVLHEQEYCVSASDEGSEQDGMTCDEMACVADREREGDLNKEIKKNPPQQLPRR